jgi:hypothetical protein
VGASRPTYLTGTPDPEELSLLKGEGISGSIAFPLPVRSLVNSPWHPEQTGSNMILGRAGATTFAHEIAGRHGAPEQSTRGHRDGKTPLDFANGNHKPAFGDGVYAPVASFPETVKVLKDRIAKAAVARP